MTIHARGWPGQNLRSTVQACETYVRQAREGITQEDVTVGMWNCSTNRYVGGLGCTPSIGAYPRWGLGTGFVFCPRSRATDGVVMLLCSLL